MKHSETNKAAAALYLWVLAVSLLPNIMMLWMGDTPLAVSLANLLIPACVYTAVLSWCRKTWAGVAVMFPVLFLAAFQLVLFNLYGNSVISADMWLNIVTTNATEVTELLGNLLVAIVVVVVLYLPPLVCAVISAFRKWRIPDRLSGIFRKSALWSGAAGVVCLCASAFGKTAVSADDFFPANAVVNLYRAVVSQSRVAGYRTTSSGFSFDAVSVAGDSSRQVQLVIIGETSRADNWSLYGYGRNTTEALDTLPGIIGFGKTLTQSNTTHKSVPMLMSHLDGKNFGDSIFRVKGLVTAYKEAGYSTAYFSNQRRNGSYIDFFGEEADSCVFVKDNMPEGTSTEDRALLDLVSGELDRGAYRQLIVLHLYGSHFNYVDRYGDDARIFLPDSYGEASKENRDKLINAYDNTIVETSHLIYSLIKMLSDRHVAATLLYVSDHGEDIFDDERGRFLHASPTPTYYQLHVPFLIWMSPEYLADNPGKAAAGRRNSGLFVSSSASLFNTALDLAGIRCRVYDGTLSVVNPDYRQPVPGFVNDHNEFVTLDKAGLSTFDMRRLHELGIPLSSDRE